MPVRKFRSVDEMNRPTWRRPGDPALYAAMASLWRRSALSTRGRLAPGVRRFRDVESLKAARRDEGA